VQPRAQADSSFVHVEQMRGTKAHDFRATREV
jgi:hypothetical protein